MRDGFIMELAETVARGANTTSLKKIVIASKTVVTNSPNSKSSRGRNILIPKITNPTNCEDLTDNL